MGNKTINNVPFTVYSVKNESSKGVNVYLGVASKNNNATTVDYFPQQVVACKTTYLFASITGTRNVKITRPTTTDPYIYVETRQVAPTSCGQIRATSFLKQGNNAGMTMRTLSSDHSIKIEDNGCNYGLSTFKYNVANVCAMNGFFYRTLGTPGRSNVVWQFKDIITSNCISMIDKNGTITFVLDPNCC